MRLIDADTLVKNLGFLYTKNRVPNVPIDVRAKETLTTIMEQATAYDVNKIVEELEKLADESYKSYCIAFNSDDRAEYDAYTNAIEIVKQGGVGEDVNK